MNYIQLQPIYKGLFWLSPHSLPWLPPPHSPPWLPAAACGCLTEPSPPPISPWGDLRTLGLQEPRQEVSYNPASWLQSMSLSKTRPHVASQQVASQSPNTYHKIQSSGMFQASALERSQEKSLWVFITKVESEHSESNMRLL